MTLRVLYCYAHILRRDHSRYVEGVGAVCDYSLFDFEQCGDERFGAAASGYMDKPQRLI